MTLVKPSTITNQAGAYNYKGSFTSPSANYIDNQFPNCLDKTNGDTATGSLTLNGATTIGGSLTINGAIAIHSDDIEFTDLSNAITIYQDLALSTSGHQMTIEAQGTSYSSGVGGTLYLSGGLGLGVSSTGGDVSISAGTGIVFDGSIILTSSVSIALVSPVIQFGSAIINPIIAQPYVAGSANGQPLSISAQWGGASGGNGGHINISGGSASTINYNGGNVVVAVGSGLGTGLPGSFYVKQNGGAVFQIGKSGMQLGSNSIALTTGTHTLSATEYNTSWITLTGTLSGATTLAFPAGNGPVIWYVSAGNLTFAGYDVSFKCGSATSVTTIGPTSSTFVAIVMVDAAGNIFVLNFA